MTDKDNGKSAFPVAFKQLVSYDVEGRPVYAEWTESGMTLRDYFAVHASAEDVKAQIENVRAKHDLFILPDGWSAIARYMHADAMLKERAK